MIETHCLKNVVIFIETILSFVLSWKNNWIILDFIWNNSDPFTELIENIRHILPEFISNNTETFREILPQRILFVRVHIKQSHYQSVTTKQYYIHFPVIISNNTFSPSYYTSSNINEVNRPVLNFLIFFYDKISQVQKAIKSTKKH